MVLKFQAYSGGGPTPKFSLYHVWKTYDVINSQGYTQAAWWNRIPSSAWLLMFLIAVLCNLMLGYAAHHLKSRKMVLSVVPLVVSIAFFLIADIDSPRGGIIHVVPQNLLALQSSL